MQAKLLQNFLSEVEGKVKLKSHFIERFHDTYPVKAMCEAFEVSRREHPFWRTFQKEIPRDQWLVDLIVGCQQQCNPTYGIRRVHHWIQRQKGKTVEPKALLRVMRKIKLLAQIRRRRTYPQLKRNIFKYPNLLQRAFSSASPTDFA